jgi:hypothetical protein
MKAFIVEQLARLPPERSWGIRETTFDCDHPDALKFHDVRRALVTAMSLNQTEAGKAFHP